MDDWGDQTVEELVSGVSSGGTPRAGDPRYYADGGIPFLKIDDLTRTKGRYVRRASEFITEAGLAESAAKVFPVGTVLVTMYGTMGLTKTLTRPMATNQAIAALIPPFSCDGAYLAHALAYRRPALERMAAQTTQPNISGAIVRRFRLPMPPIAEQRRIAEILDTIDEAIQATEHVIAKLGVCRKGLLDDLIGEIEHHERLGENLDRIDAGWSPACAERPPNGSEWGVLKVSSITREDFNPAESKTLPPSLPARPDLIVRVGDVLTARANGVAGLVGRTAFVDDLGGRNLLISDKTLRLVPGPKLSPRFLSYCMQHEMVRSQVRGLISGSTGQGNISQAELRSLQLPTPSRQQQHAIESVVASVDGRLSAERLQVSKLRALRAGLAADLLSGRVRTVTA